MIKVNKHLDVELGTYRVRLPPRDAVRLGEKLIVSGVRALARSEYQSTRRRAHQQKRK
jgi:hypothetical protein